MLEDFEKTLKKIGMYDGLVKERKIEMLQEEEESEGKKDGEKELDEGGPEEGKKD